MPKVAETKKEQHTAGVEPSVVQETAEKPASRTKSAKVADDLFAIIATGGKQYKVSLGDKVKIEKLKGEYKEGDTIVFDKILLVDDGKDATIGTPYIATAKVEGTLEKIARAKKVDVVKYKAKSNYFKRNGHRQPYFEIKITAIK